VTVPVGQKVLDVHPERTPALYSPSMYGQKGLPDVTSVKIPVQGGFGLARQDSGFTISIDLQISLAASWRRKVLCGQYNIGTSSHPEMIPLS
jgi:hypothetical protein